MADIDKIYLQFKWQSQYWEGCTSVQNSKENGVILDNSK
jgi:hypothetical protein